MRALSLAVLILCVSTAVAVGPPVAPFVPNHRVDADGRILPPGAVRAFGATRFRHGESNLGDYAPDGKTLVTAGGPTLNRWDATTGRLLRQIQPPGVRQFAAIRHTQDGLGLWAAGRAGTVEEPRMLLFRLDLTHGTVLEQYEPKAFADAINPNVSPTGRMLISSSGRGHILYDPKANDVIKTWAEDNRRGGGCWSMTADGTGLAIGSGNRMRLIDKDLQQVAAFDCPNLRDVALGNSLKRVVTSHVVRDANGSKGYLMVWNVGTDKSMRIDLPIPNGEYVNPTIFLGADDKAIVCDCGENRRWMIDADTGKVTVPFQTHMPTAWYAVRPDGREVASGSTSIGFWDIPTGRRLDKSGELFDAGNWDSTGFEFSPDGATLTFLPDADPIVRTWDTKSGAEVRAEPWKVVADAGRLAGVRWNTYTGPGHRLTARSADGKVLVQEKDRTSDRDEIGVPTRLDIRVDGRTVRSIDDVASGLGQLQLTPDGRFLVGGQFGRTTIWETATGKEVEFKNARPMAGNDLDFESTFGPRTWLFADSRTVAILQVNGTQNDGNSRHGVVVYDLPTGQELYRLTGPGLINRMTTSADGRWLAVVGRTRSDDNEVNLVIPRFGSIASMRAADRGFLTVYDLTLRRSLYTRDRIPACDHLCFSPDGLTLATGHEDETQLWETVNGTVRRTFAPAGGPVAFSPDGTRLATLGLNKHVYLWDVRGDSEPKSATYDLPKDLPKDWADWAGSAETAYPAMQRAAADPAATVAWLAGHDFNLPAITPARVTECVQNLDAPQFAVRKKADAELRRFAAVSESALRKALASTTSAEVRERIEAILNAPPRLPTGDEARAVRAVEVLGWIGTPDAVRLLQRWAGAEMSNRMTLEAQATLARRK